MANENLLKVGFQTDVSKLTSDLIAATTVIKDFGKSSTAVIDNVQKSFAGFSGSGDKIVKTFTDIGPAVDNAGAGFSDIKSIIDSSGNVFGVFGQKVTSAITQINTSNAGITNVTAAINEMAAAAIKAGGSSFAIGVKAPIEDIDVLRKRVQELKTDLAGGFKPIVNVVNPNTPALLNSVSAALTNISPAVKSASNALTQASDDVNAFGLSINRSLADAVKRFDKFKIEALQLGSAFDKIPASLKPFNTSGIVALRSAVKGLKTDLTDLKFASVNREFASVNRSAAATGAAFKTGIAPGARQANAALLDVGRVLQDLPYGFIGIQNNITQLPGSFRALSLAAKESGQSMGKVLLSSLTGAGGIGIAISAVTAALTFASYGFGAWTRILGDTGKKTKEAADRTKEFVDSLQSVADIRIESSGNVEGEIAKVNALVAAIRDETKSQQDRGRAIQALQQINKEQFSNIDTTIAGLARLTAATENYTKSLIAQAVVEGFKDEIKKIAPELAKQERILTTLAAAFSKVAGAQDNLTKAALPDVKNFAGTFQAVSALQDFGDQQQKLVDQINVVGKLRITYADITEAIKGAVDAAIKLPSLAGDKKNVDGLKKEDAQLKSLKDSLEGFRKELEIVKELRKEGLLPKFREDDALKLQENILSALAKIDTREVELKLKPKLEIDKTLNELQLKKITEEFGVNVSSEVQIPIIASPKLNNEKGFFAQLKKVFDKNQILNALAGFDLKLPLTISPFVSNISKAFENLLPPGFSQPMINRLTEAGKTGGEAYSEALSVSLRDISSSGIGDSIAALGEGLGAALTSGENPILSAAKSFLSVIGSVLQQMGKEIIVASKLVIALKAALAKAFANPAASLVAGIALVIAGSALKNIKFNIPKLATGGITTGPTLAMIGESGREAVIPLNRGGDIFGASTEVEFVESKIRGGDIYEVWKIHKGKNDRLL